MRRYDFGGGEYVEEDTTHVVDILSAEKIHEYNPDYTGDIIHGDITTPLQLTPGDHVNISQVLRYHNSERGHLQGDPIDPVKLLQIASNIHDALLPGGTVHIFDHVELAAIVAGMLMAKDYTTTRADMINPADEDYPEEWRFELRRPNS
jgi:hypothetical protein